MNSRQGKLRDRSNYLPESHSLLGLGLPHRSNRSRLGMIGFRDKNAKEKGRNFGCFNYILLSAVVDAVRRLQVSARLLRPSDR